MINEYFVQPDLIYKWAEDHKDTAFFLHRLGLGHPRLISSFPKKNGSKLKAFLTSSMPESLSDSAKSRVDELIVSLSEEAIPRAVPTDLPDDWVEAAKQVCQTDPPDVVLSASQADAPGSWITESAAYQQGSCFDHRLQADPPRTAEAFTQVVRNLLRYSRQIVVVDPYLSKNAGLETILSFLECTQDHRHIGGQVQFQLVYDSEKGASYRHVQDRIQPALEGKEILLDIIPVKEREGGEKLHNRYLLTEFGGVSFGVGTDAGEEYHSDDLFLLDCEKYLLRWGQYWRAAAFDRAVLSSPDRRQASSA